MFGLDILYGPLVTTFAIGISFAVLLYWYSTRNYNYWKKRGVPTAKTYPFVGSVGEYSEGTLHDIEAKRYRELGPIYGHFEGSRPLLSVAEPDLIRDILVKDFYNFSTRRKFETGDKKVDSMLSVAHGETWKRIRTIVSPTFSTGKIKRMLGIFNECSTTLVQNFRTSAVKGEPVDAKRLFGAFTMDVIASSAFSTKIDSHNDPENKFVKTARTVFSAPRNWRTFIFIIFPKFARFLRLRIFFPEASDFFNDVTMQIIKERRRTGQVRNDFLQLLLDTSKEVAEVEKKLDHQEKNENEEVEERHQIFKNYTTNKHLSMDELVAQCVIFFLAGYDTTASTLLFATYLLALHPDKQEKAQQEVDEALKKTNGEVTYEAAQSLVYLDNIISETLRLYTPLIRLDRQADANYQLGDTGIMIEKDMVVTIPVHAMHHDPKFYPEPEKFIPERFDAYEKAQRNPYTYMPFGDGPRNCVAKRFALLEVKSCLMNIIANFMVKPCEQTKIPIEFASGSQGVLQPKEVILKFEERKGIAVQQ